MEKLKEICEGMSTGDIQTQWKEGTCMGVNHWMLRQIKAVNATGTLRGFACIPDMKENIQAFDCCMGGKTWVDDDCDGEDGSDDHGKDEGLSECKMPKPVSNLDVN